MSRSPRPYALWLEVSGVQGNAFTYDMYFRRLDEAGEQDLVQHGDDLSIVVPEEHADNIRGSTLDLSGGGLLLQNPNSPQLAPAMSGAAPDLDLSDPVVAKVVEVLDTQINPQIAAHGGFAELVAIEAPVAYLRMGGGCQGCGMAAVTLSQGIEVALLESVPEITEVVDVTDHASGGEPVLRGRQEVAARTRRYLAPEPGGVVRGVVRDGRVGQRCARSR